MKEIILAGIRCSLFYILSSFFSTIETSSPRCWPPGGPLHVSSGQCFKLCNWAAQGQAGTSASSAPAQPFLVILTSASPTPQPLPLTVPHDWHWALWVSPLEFFPILLPQSIPSYGFLEGFFGASFVVMFFTGWDHALFCCCVELFFRVISFSPLIPLFLQVPFPS